MRQSVGDRVVELVGGASSMLPLVLAWAKVSCCIF